jgi:hypothetical protein
MGHQTTLAKATGSVSRSVMPVVRNQPNTWGIRVLQTKHTKKNEKQNTGKCEEWDALMHPLRSTGRHAEGILWSSSFGPPSRIYFPLDLATGSGHQGSPGPFKSQGHAGVVLVEARDDHLRCNAPQFLRKTMEQYGTSMRTFHLQKETVIMLHHVHWLFSRCQIPCWSLCWSFI